MTKNEMTPSREAALSYVREGSVYRISFPVNGKPYFTVEPYWQKPRQQPYEWLLANGFIRLGPLALRKTKVIATSKAEAYYDREWAS